MGLLLDLCDQASEEPCGKERVGKKRHRPLQFLETRRMASRDEPPPLFFSVAHIAHKAFVCAKDMCRPHLCSRIPRHVCKTMSGFGGRLRHSILYLGRAVGDGDTFHNDLSPGRGQADLPHYYRFIADANPPPPPPFLIAKMLSLETTAR